jgi:hypothetical protein
MHCNFVLGHTQSQDPSSKLWFRKSSTGEPDLMLQTGLTVFLGVIVQVTDDFSHSVQRKVGWISCEDSSIVHII